MTGHKVLEGKHRGHQERQGFQVERPDTLLFATLEGLEKQSGVSRYRLRRLILKELTDNALDAADIAGRPGEVEITRLARNRYAIEDQGAGIPGTADDLAALFALHRPMLSGKFWRRPERGALGNGLRIIVGAVAATGGTIEIATRSRRVVLHPRKAGHTQIIETADAERQVGTRIVVAFGADLPDDAEDLSWANVAIGLAQAAGPPYARRPSPHWFDADHVGETLSIVKPPDTTVRRFLEQWDGCTGATAGRLAAPFGKGRVCGDLTEHEARELLTAAQAVAREVKPLALGPVGETALTGFDGYARRTGSFSHGEHEPTAEIPFIVECWAYVTDRKGHNVEIAVLANRTPIVADVTARHTFEKSIVIGGVGLTDSIDVQLGDCSIVLHIASPLIPIRSIGKHPDLSVFEAEIGEAVKLAFNRSRRLLSPEPEQPKPERVPKPEPKPKLEAFVPLGPLGQRIEAAAAASGLRVDDLTVLSEGLDPYRFDNQAGHRAGEWFAEQVARFVPDSEIVHLRGLFYRIVASSNVRRPDGNGQPFTNTEANWTWLQSRAAKAARWLGCVRFDRIRDERNAPPELFGTNGAPITSNGGARGLAVYGEGTSATLPPLDEMLPSLVLVGVPSPRQPFRIAMIGEKSSLGAVLRPMAREVEAELLLSSGEASETHIAEMVERAAGDGRPLRVLYFADFDPSGWQMPISVARKMQAHRDLRFPSLQIEVYRVALTLEQCVAHHLPSTPLKTTEKRAEKWREKWGHSQTEIDALAALQPDVLRQIARDAVAPFYDFTLAGRIEAAKMLPDAAADWFEALPEHAEAVTAITAVHATAAKAVDALNDERRRVIRTLREAFDDATDTPGLPEIDVRPVTKANAPEPLFTTADSFALASRKLKDSKKLIGEEDDIEDADDGSTAP